MNKKQVILMVLVLIIILSIGLNCTFTNPSVQIDDPPQKSDRAELLTN